MTQDVILEEHLSPDGMLSLSVTESDGGDITIGFVGYSWHTHGDMLGGTSQDVAVRGFVDSIMNDEVIIAISLVDGKITDVYPTDNPSEDLESMNEYEVPGESIQFRYWSGKAID